MKKSICTIFAAVIAIAMLTGCGSSPKAYDSATSENGAFLQSSSSSASMVQENADTVTGSGAMNGSADNKQFKAPDTQSEAMVVADKIIYSFDMEMETLKYDETIDSINKLIDQHKGFIQSSESYGKSIYTKGRSSRSSVIVAKIPVADKDSFLSELEEIGNITRINKSAENVTTQYYDIDSQLRSLRVQESRLLEILEKASSVDELITVESELTNVRYKIESLTTDLNRLDHLTAYSTYNIYINEVYEYSESESGNPGFWTRTGDSFKNSFKAFVSFLEGALTVIIFLLPYIIIAAVILIIILIIVKKSKKQSALKTAKQDKNQNKDKE